MFFNIAIVIITYKIFVLTFIENNFFFFNSEKIQEDLLYKKRC